MISKKSLSKIIEAMLNKYRVPKKIPITLYIFEIGHDYIHAIDVNIFVCRIV